MNIGIDLGGTKTEIIVLEKGNELYRKRIATPRGNYAGIVQQLASLIDETAHEFSIPVNTAVGIGIPGAVSRLTGKIKNANTTELIGEYLAGDLMKLTGRTVLVENDANCLALSEAVDGAGEPFHTVFAVITGTGTGAGISIGKRILRGANSIGGEWGHNPMPYLTATDYPGRKCYCGKMDCVETYLSGPGLSRTYEERTGQKLLAKQIYASALEGNMHSIDVIDLYADQMARALSVVINILDPDAIVLAGGVSNMEMLYTLVPQKWGRYVFSDIVDTVLLKAAHGDSSGVRGAAWLV